MYNPELDLISKGIKWEEFRSILLKSKIKWITSYLKEITNEIKLLPGRGILYKESEKEFNEMKSIKN